ncbi:MAG: OmpA family protein [Chitinophagales bacterium]|nr:OmpA family protein [Chitinophagaceae bacterium]MCB9066087.1 OmpA family protein [Chitinophagales bacterium]
MHRILLIALISMSIKAGAKESDTIKVYFDIAVYNLNSNAKQQLDSLAYNDVLIPKKKYGIIGYADYLGTESSNVTLSENRANAVKDYLLGLGIQEEYIETVTGVGEVSREQEQANGYPEDRRVDIVIGGFKPKKNKPDVKPGPPKKGIDIAKVKKNETIRLDKIFFVPGSHFVRDESLEQLVQLYLILKDNPTVKISIEGHICCHIANTYDGYDFDSKDFRLSENRAKQVYNFLIEKGIDRDRLSYKGLSNKQPLISPERTPMDENMNRRVEIRIIDK